MRLILPLFPQRKHSNNKLVSFDHAAVLPCIYLLVIGCDEQVFLVDIFRFPEDVVTEYHCNNTSNSSMDKLGRCSIPSVHQDHWFHQRHDVSLVSVNLTSFNHLL